MKQKRLTPAQQKELDETGMVITKDRIIRSSVWIMRTKENADKAIRSIARRVIV